MKSQRFLVIGSILLTPVLLTGLLLGGDKKKPKNDLCAGGNTQSFCTAANTCGSATSPCVVDIRRSDGESASATPEIPDGKPNEAFCVKAGTTIRFVSKSKNTGFVLDFGTSSPFDTGTAIMGGADRPVSVVAKKVGCYTYSVGACTAGTMYGMCGEDAAQFVVSAK